jgi:hypothetical protein
MAGVSDASQPDSPALLPDHMAHSDGRTYALALGSKGSIVQHSQMGSCLVAHTRRLSSIGAPSPPVGTDNTA